MKKLIIFVVMLALIPAVCLFLFAALWGNLPELIFQRFLPREVFNKKSAVTLNKVAQIESINNYFSFSNKKDKVAYIDPELHLEILDLNSGISKKIYTFRDSDYNKMFARRDFMESKFRISWSSDDSKILFADFPDLFVYCFADGKLAQEGYFRLLDEEQEERFKKGVMNCYGYAEYAWANPATIMYLYTPIPYSKAFRGKQYLVKNIDDGASYIFTCDMTSGRGIFTVDALQWSSPQKALIKTPPFPLTSSGVNLQNAQVTERDENKFLLVEIDEKLPVAYQISIKKHTPPLHGSARIDYELRIRSPKESLGLLDVIVNDPALIDLKEKTKLNDAITSVLYSMVVITYYEDRSPAYEDYEEKYYEGEKSPDGTTGHYFKGNDLCLVNTMTSDFQEIPLEPITKKYWFKCPASCWLSNEYILFYGGYKSKTSIEDNIYKFNLASHAITKYPKRFYPVFYPSPRGERVVTFFKEGEYMSGDGTFYRYDTITLFDALGHETILYKYLRRNGAIVAGSWINDGKYFCFIESDERIKHRYIVKAFVFDR